MAQDYLINSLEVKNFHCCRSPKDRRFTNFTSIGGGVATGKTAIIKTFLYVFGNKKETESARRNCSVKIGLVFVDRKTKEFERSEITEDSTGFQIDGVDVPKETYLTELENLKIDVKKKQFLVCEEGWEKIAIETPRALARMLEQLIGFKLKNSYKDLKKKLHAQEERERTVSSMKKLDEMKQQIQTIKEKRSRQFRSILTYVADQFAHNYNLLNGNGNLHGSLKPVHVTEPYLGIEFVVMENGYEKEVIAMSSGEKAVLSLAFIFAVRSFIGSPFIIIDDIDKNFDRLSVQHHIGPGLQKIALTCQLIAVRKNSVFDLFSNGRIPGII